MSRVSRKAQCPWCPVVVQPLDPSTTYVSAARQTCERLAVPIPSDLLTLATVSHWMIAHDEKDLLDYMRSYG